MFAPIATEHLWCASYSWRPWQKRTHCCGHVVANTNVSPFARARSICCGHKKCFWFCSETFCVRNKCFPVCAAQETSWATMCPQQCVLVCQYLALGTRVPRHVFQVRAPGQNSTKYRCYCQIVMVFRISFLAFRSFLALPFCVFLWLVQGYIYPARTMLRTKKAIILCYY